MFKVRTQFYFKQLKNLTCGPKATLPDNSIIHAPHDGVLPFSNILLNQAKNSYVFPGLSNESLLLVCQLCNNNCIAIYSKNSVCVLKQTKLNIQGCRNFSDGL